MSKNQTSTAVSKSVPKSPIPAKKQQNITSQSAALKHHQQRKNAIFDSLTNAARLDSAKVPLNDVKTVFSDAADGYLAAALSASTMRGFESDKRHFAANGLTVPATVADVVNYLALFAGQLSVGTLERRLISLHKAHQEISAPSPVHDDVVKATMQGIRRLHGKAPDRKRAVVKDDLLQALVLVARQKPVKSARDRALLLLCFCAALRRSEVVAIRVEHITFVENGLEVFLPRSKTDQTGQGYTLYVPRATSHERCPVAALKHWLELAQIAESFVFRSVNRHDKVANEGLTAQSVALVVKASVARVNGKVDAQQVSGHSLRAGFVTTASEQNWPSWKIRQVTRHTNDATLGVYIRSVQRKMTQSLL